MSQPRIVLVSREVAPFGGGGIGVYVTSLARVLGKLGDVTVVTTDLHRQAFEECARGNGADAFPEGVEMRFVEEPEGELAATDYRLAHEWSARVWEAVRRVCAERPVDLIEFPDWGGEACVTLQAKRTFHEALRHTRVCVRAHSTVEMNAMLNGCLPDDIETLRLFDLERFALQFADTLIWAGGDILESYRLLYGRDGLASAQQRIRHPAPTGTTDVSHYPHRAKRHPLRVLYLGRAERRKGVERVVSALRGLDEDEIELTLVGADTQTAALGVSMCDVLDLATAGDARVVFREPESRSDILELIAEHDLGVLPSLWECWPNVVLEFLASNRPVLATPTGGPVEMIEHGVSGWHTRGTSSEAIAEAFRQVIASGEAVDEMIDARAPRRRFEALTDEAEILDGYRELLGGRGAETRRRRHYPPLVSIVVPYFALDQFVEETVASLVAQTYQQCEIIVVNDGSFEPDDVVLERLTEPPFEITLVTQENRGCPEARNFGFRQSQGRYVLPFDADNVLDPTFVERCVEVLEHDPSVAYVTSWERLIDEQGMPTSAPDWQWHYRFVSNSCATLQRENIAGDAPAVFRRSLFDAGFSYYEMLSGYEDWELYQRLASAGHYGHVIPEPLVAYRIRAESTLRQVGQPNDERLRGEIRAARVATSIGWEIDR